VLGLPNPLFDYIRTYQCLRNKLPGLTCAPTDCIFYSYPPSGQTPRPINHSTLNKAINRVWKKVHPGRSISATLFRKYIVTTVRKEKPETRESLASHMSHAASTSDRYYNRMHKVDTALDMAHMITRIVSRPKVIIHMRILPNTCSRSIIFIFVGNVALKRLNIVKINHVMSPRVLLKKGG